MLNPSARRPKLSVSPGASWETQWPDAGGNRIIQGYARRLGTETRITADDAGGIGFDSRPVCREQFVG